jgi:dTDP-4-amino-4,6-dideoxygalactose transaminase
MKIPFFDLVTQYQDIREEIQREVLEVLESGFFILGEKVEKFEEEFAQYIGVRHCIGLNSGTTALVLAMKALGIGEGDEVIIPCNTFIATYEAVKDVGATPVLVEPEEWTYNLNPFKVEKAITKKTKAIVPVHLYGQASDMNSLLKIAREHDMYVIEDAAQAHGTLYYSLKTNGHSRVAKAGSMGDVGAFSFYPGKNLGAYGEGGCIVTNDDHIADRVKILRDHGQVKKYYHDVLGGNYRMDSIQGAVLRVKLKRLDEWNEKRREWASLYDDILSSQDVIPPFEADYGRHSYHLYVIRVKQRDELIKYLASKGIGTGIHYPIPIHQQKVFEETSGRDGKFPITTMLSQEILSLPIFPELKEEQILYVAYQICQFLYTHRDKSATTRRLKIGIEESVPNPVETDQSRIDFPG